jgi:glyoxylase-like metal-dependent hydrolase (beta-lactamase superfamily II)
LAPIVTTVFTNTSDRQYGGVLLLDSPENGRYPSGNSLVISGTDGSVLVDPSMEVTRRGGSPVGVDLVLLSHAHEDHVAGLHLFPDVPVLAHPDETAAVADPEVLLGGFGVTGAQAEEFRADLRDRFHVRGHSQVRAFADGDVLDLGGRRVTVLHLPGHTSGHCGFLVEPDGFLFLGDIDLSAFGPYYGDLSSSLEDFEASIARCRDVEARWYGTSHHKGVVEGRQEFLVQLDAFAEVIGRREEAMLRFLSEPRTLADLVAHRFVYRAHVDLPFAEAVERRTARLHVERLQREGLVHDVGDGLFHAV